MITALQRLFLIGVTCDNISWSTTYGRIISINFTSGVDLSGTLPYSIGNFQSVTALSFVNNSIAGPIPYSISGLSSLRYLDLHGNYVSAALSFLTSLTSLRYLDLHNNPLYGTISYSLGGWQSLEYIDLHNTSLIGSIPSVFGALPLLRYLNLSYNSFSGTIPKSFQPPLTELDLGHNKLYGTIPPLSSSLNILKLDSNSLTGKIPTTMRYFSMLRILNLSNNDLTMGPAAFVPTDTFSTYTLSQYINLENNCLAFDTSFPYPYRHVVANRCKSEY